MTVKAIPLLQAFSNGIFWYCCAEQKLTRYQLTWCVVWSLYATPEPPVECVVSDMAVFMLKMDVKLQPNNQPTNQPVDCY